VHMSSYLQISLKQNNWKQSEKPFKGLQIAIHETKKKCDQIQFFLIFLIL
jgi:hypothetical protein